MYNELGYCIFMLSLTVLTSPDCPYRIEEKKKSSIHSPRPIFLGGSGGVVAYDHLYANSSGRNTGSGEVA